MSLLEQQLAARSYLIAVLSLQCVSVAPQLSACVSHSIAQAPGYCVFRRALSTASYSMGIIFSAIAAHFTHTALLQLLH
jgi:hypothetical protein